MGLDISLNRMGKVDNTKTYTEEEFEKQYDACPSVICLCSEGDPCDRIKGLSKDYICKVSVGFFDPKKMLASKGKNIDDGWKWASTSFGFHEDEREKLGIPAEVKADDVLEIVKFVIRGEEGKRKDEVRIVVTKNNWKSFDTQLECWCYYDAQTKIGYMRKGANDRFYADGVWDSDALVFSKEVLKEHMEKYFDEKEERYGNAKAYFKENIYDKFKDGEGFYVIYH